MYSPHIILNNFRIFIIIYRFLYHIFMFAIARPRRAHVLFSHFGISLPSTHHNEASSLPSNKMSHRSISSFHHMHIRWWSRLQLALPTSSAHICWNCPGEWRAFQPRSLQGQHSRLDLLPPDRQRWRAQAHQHSRPSQPGCRTDQSPDELTHLSQSYRANTVTREKITSFLK